MRKKQGGSYTLYLPKPLMDKARVIADERDKSTSHIVANALREFLRKAAEQGVSSTPSA